MNDTGFLPIFIYLLGMLIAAALLARPIRRIMGVSDRSQHVDPDSARDADLIASFIVIGAAALWPATLPMLLVYRFIPASDEDEDTEQYSGASLVFADYTTD